MDFHFFGYLSLWRPGSMCCRYFFHLDENYLRTAFKTLNYNFFTPEAIAFIQNSPDWLVAAFAGLFCVVWFLFLIGYASQFSCILMTATCYYFYAFDAFYIGTLSWDILLVTLFLMCLTPYHGDYFSVDWLRRGDTLAYRRQRPFFIQRLLQLQIGFTYFYTALYKVSSEGNWFSGNPIYYLMHYPHSVLPNIFAAGFPGAASAVVLYNRRRHRGLRDHFCFSALLSSNPHCGGLSRIYFSYYVDLDAGCARDLLFPFSPATFIVYRSTDGHWVD